MLKLKAQGDNGPVLILGLSALNLERLKEGMPIKFKMGELGLEGEMVIFAGSTEGEMLDDLVAAQLVDPALAARVKAAQARGGKAEQT